jgi:polysaccharide chain length determinant protein (PEP-CTERM system associated)
MINPGKTLTINDAREILVRRLWYALIPFVVICVGTVLFAIYAPREYRATTLVLVTPQKVPEQFVAATVTSKIEERLHSIAQEITSRTRLEQVISEFNLYSEKRGKVSQEEIIDLMRKNIEIEIPKRDKEKSSFTISFVGKDPKVVAMVTNKLASLFIEENLKLREQQAQGTTEFLAVELSATKAKLEEQEKAITQFKRQYAGELPEQREANIRVFEQLQNLYQRVTESIRSAQDRRVVIQKQLSDIDLMIASLTKRGESSGRETGGEAGSEEVSAVLNPGQSAALSRAVGRSSTKDPLEVYLDQLRNHLIDLQGKYTEKHPEIRVTKRKIADLEAQVEKLRVEREAEEKELLGKLETGVDKAQGQSKAASFIDPTIRQEILRLAARHKETENQLVATDLEIERLKEEEGKIKAQMARYRERIENTPIREQMMSNLARDYQNLKESYQNLLKKSRDAEQAENLERRQKGEQFKVIDPARVPEKPFRPNIPKVLLIGLLLAVGGGLGIAFVREQMDRSFQDPDDLEAALGLRVLANIPKIKNPRLARNESS